MITPITAELKNGLKVVLTPTHVAPVTAFQVWVGVGSADEEKEEEGLAHVLEHMLFKGTKRRAVGEITRDVERAGGQINAWTSYEETVYYITLASRYRDQGLDILADAIQNATLDADELAMELQVIREEIRMGEDSADQALVKILFNATFGKHPYGRPIIGFDSSVRRFSRQKVMQFYKRWYVPRNMILSVAGDFDPDEMLAKISSAFGGFGPKRSPARSPRPTEPSQRKLRIASAVKPVGEARFALAFPIPGLSHADVPALDLLAGILGQGMSARLETRVRRELGLVTDIRAMAYTPTDMGVFAVMATCPHVHLQKAVAATVRVLNLDYSGPITPEEVRKARTLIEAEAIFSEETVDGLARKTGFYQLHTRDLAFEEKYLAAVARVNETDVTQAAAHYLSPKRATFAAVVPDPAHRPAKKRLPWIVRSDKGRAFDPGKLADTIRPVMAGLDEKRARRRQRAAKEETQIFPLSSGDLLLVRRDPNARIVAARAAFYGGLRYESQSEAGLFALLSNTLVRGTTAASAEEVAAMMDTLACSISGFSGRNTIGIQGEFLSTNFADGFALMGTCLRMPALSEPEVAREKELLVEDIRQGLDNPSKTAFRCCFEALFGDHPYARLSHGTEETVAALTPDALRRGLEDTCGPGKMVLAVVGGVNAAEVHALSESILVTKSARGAERPAPGAWTPPSAPVQVTTTLPKEQSHIVMGFPGTTLNSDDRYTVEVLTEILGGHGGRLFDQIREEMGLAYSVTAVSMEGIEPGYIALYAATSPGSEAAVVAAMTAEIEKILTEKPKRDELTRIKRHLIGARAIAWQRTGTRAASMSLDQLYGNGHDAGERYPREIDKVTAADVVTVARRYLGSPGKVISCVGPDADALKLV